MAASDAFVPKPGDDAPDLELLDIESKPIRLSDLWAKGPLVLFFYRGDFSQECRKQMVDFRDNALAFRKLGARLAAVSTDEPAIAAYLRLDRGLPFDLLCDPTREVIDAWGLLERAHGGVARPAAFVIDRAGVVRSRSLDTDERRVSADALLLFLRRGGASGSRPLRARFARLMRRLFGLEDAVREGLRTMLPGQRVS